VAIAQNVPVRPGELVTFGGWAYRESGVSGSVRWKLAVLDSNLNQFAYPDPSPNNVASASWIYQVGSYTVPSNGAYVTLYAEIYNATSSTVARFDDGFVGFSALAGSGPLYYVEDSLGTSRVVTDGRGVVCYDADFYPYGGERPYTNTCPQNYKFEGKERDAETGNDDFGARSYSNRFGRWLSSDWSSTPVAVPYANLTNPQTLNLYSMVADDPESFADLDGHCWAWAQKLCNFWNYGVWTDDKGLEVALQKRADAARAEFKKDGVTHGGQTSDEFLADKSNKEIVDLHMEYQLMRTFGQLGNLPPIPPNLTTADFGQNVMKWGRGDNEARARIQTLTREELEKSGVTKEMAKEWRDFYRQVKMQNTGNPSAAGRADLMQRAYQLLGGTEP